MKDKKGTLSRGVRLLRERIKESGTRLAGKILGRHSFSLLGVPAGLTSGVEKEQGEVIPLYPSKRIALQPPRTVDRELHWKFRELSQSFELTAQGLLCVPQGLATRTGGNLSHQGKLITTFLQNIDGKLPHQHDLLRFSTKKFFPPLFVSDHPVVTLTSGWQGAFYHWIYEVLLRLHLVEKGGYGQEKIFVEATLPFQKESLELMGISSDRIIPAHTYSGVKTPHLIIPSISEIPTPWGCQYLREKIIPKLSKRPSLRLYISREDASRRRILNEEEVFGMLKQVGFMKVELSRLTFKEQAELFLAAEAVVGPHGAGFSHLVFCHPRTPILEIFAPAYCNVCYWHVSEQAGLTYHCLFGEGERYPDGVDTHLDPDITVNLNQLKASLHLMGINTI
jgi:capsular polysaccharide biosynthesis protein